MKDKVKFITPCVSLALFWLLLTRYIVPEEIFFRTISLPLFKYNSVQLFLLDYLWISIFHNGGKELTFLFLSSFFLFRINISAFFLFAVLVVLEAGHILFICLFPFIEVFVQQVFVNHPCLCLCYISDFW
jgi:hypothetical protein